MSNPNRHPLIITPTTLDRDRILEILRIHGEDPDSVQGRQLISTIAASPSLSGVLATLDDGNWTLPIHKPSVRRTDRIPWRSFEEWCRRHGFESLPASTETVNRYLRSYADTVAPSSVQRSSQTIGRAHRQARLPDPTDHHSVDEVLSAIARSAAKKGRRPQPREDASFDDVKALIDAIDGGGYWSEGLDLSEPGQLLVARMIAARWRAIILTEWAGSLAARDTLWATVDDLAVDAAVTMALPATVEYPHGSQVRILRYEERRYDPISALADWIGLLLPVLPPCRALFPHVNGRRNPKVVCRVCGATGKLPHTRTVPDQLESRLAAAVRNDGTAFTLIAAEAGLRDGSRSLTRDGLRTGVRGEATLNGASEEDIRRHLRRSSTQTLAHLHLLPGSSEGRT